MKQKYVKNRTRGCCILIGLSAINSAYSMNASVPLFNYISGKLCGSKSSHIDTAKISRGYYEKAIIDGKFRKLDNIDYQDMVSKVKNGVLANLSPLWSIYENYKESDSYFKKIVGSVSAFLAAVCASNDDKLALSKIKHGVDVYKCLLNLGYDNLKNPSQADKKEMTFDKLMTSLPEFMASLKTQKLLDKVTKGRKGGQGDQKTPVTKVNMKKWGKK